MNKQNTILVIIIALVVGWMMFFTSGRTPVVDNDIGGRIKVCEVGSATSTEGCTDNETEDTAAADTALSNNVSMENGVQIVNLRAKGGYSPQNTVAKAGVPTVLRFITSGTFDCSLAVRIPSINYSKTLPQTGITDIDIGTQSAGPFVGTCSMGMYPFRVDFR